LENHSLLLRVCSDQEGLALAKTRVELARVLARHDAQLPFDEDESTLRSPRFVVLSWQIRFRRIIELSCSFFRHYVFIAFFSLFVFFSQSRLSIENLTRHGRGCLRHLH
jgi:hypothetical protein